MARTSLGLALLALGVVLTASPLPGGFLVLVPALRILHGSSATARLVIARVRASHPLLGRVVGKALPV